MNEGKVKACPFCGGGAVLGADMNPCPEYACDACGANVSGKGPDGALKAWNTRPAEQELVEALKDALVDHRFYRFPDDPEDFRRVYAKQLDLLSKYEGGAE